MLDIAKYKWYFIGFLLIYIGINYLRISYKKKEEENNEGFQNSVNPINNNTVQFDTNYYLRDTDKSVLVKRTYNVIPFRCNTYTIPELNENEKDKTYESLHYHHKFYLYILYLAARQLVILNFRFVMVEYLY